MLYKATYRLQAEEKLKELGIEFDSVKGIPLKGQLVWGAVSPSDEIVHQYFMKGDCDVAYYTPRMACLYVHDKPRQWGAETLKSAINV